MPILAVVFKIYTDKQKLQTEALISESHTKLIKVIESNKTDFSKQLAGINEKLTINIVEDKRRDADLKRQGRDIEKLQA